MTTLTVFAPEFYLYSKKWRFTREAMSRPHMDITPIASDEATRAALTPYKCPGLRLAGTYLGVPEELVWGLFVEEEST